MVTRALIISMKQAAFRKRRDGRTYGESFTISKLRTNPPLQLKPWNASLARFDRVHPTDGSPAGDIVGSMYWMVLHRPVEPARTHRELLILSLLDSGC
jgi:hypothetical protein